MKMFSIAVAALILSASSVFAQSISCAEGEGVSTIYAVETAEKNLKFEVAIEFRGPTLRAIQKSCLPKDATSTHYVDGMPGVYESQVDAAFAFAAFARLSRVKNLTPEAIAAYLPIAKSLGAERDAAIAKVEAANKIAETAKLQKKQPQWAPAIFVEDAPAVKK